MQDHPQEASTQEAHARLAHELRSPLAAMRAAVRILQRAPHDAAMVALARDTLERQLEELARSIDRFASTPASRAASRPSASATRAAATPAIAAASRRRIVVADDDRDLADGISAALRLAGHEVWTAYDGDQAIERVRESDAEVVVLDLGMPKLDGYEAARRIRAAPGGDRRLLIAVSGWTQEAHRRRASQAGFDRHFAKPPDLGAIESVIAAGRAEPAESLP